MERLQKVIANSGYTSRRKAEELIVNKEVFVNHTHMFFINPDRFKAIFEKYDKADLVRCIEKNAAVVEKL